MQQKLANPIVVYIRNFPIEMNVPKFFQKMKIQQENSSDYGYGFKFLFDHDSQRNNGDAEITFNSQYAAKKFLNDPFWQAKYDLPLKLSLDKMSLRTKDPKALV